VKSEVFKKLDSLMKPGAILGSNTSTLDVDKIAEVTQRPGDVVGLHFFSPANVMRLLEVVRSKHTAPDVMATTMAIAKKIKKVAVVSGVCDGFIGNRMFEMYIKQAYAMVEEGATPEQVDKAAEAFGMAMGPFRVIDLAGNDIGWAIRKRRMAENPAEQYSPIPDKVCEMGRFGQKVGKGWYDYEAGKREPRPAAEVLAAIDAARVDLGITPRAFTSEEIVGRLMLALVNEGARILAEGIANRASDCDMVYLNGYGFPLFRGGPMLYADMLGLPKVVEMIKRYQQNPRDDAKFWEPAALLAKLAAAGKTFN
jgi:3-hydroxyacyl-CoA dehydrogenase